jgi:hypothetical protein
VQSHLASEFSKCTELALAPPRSGVSHSLNVLFTLLARDLREQSVLVKTEVIGDVHSGEFSCSAQMWALGDHLNGSAGDFHLGKSSDDAVHEIDVVANESAPTVNCSMT